VQRATCARGHTGCWSSGRRHVHDHLIRLRTTTGRAHETRGMPCVRETRSWGGGHLDLQIVAQKGLQVGSVLVTPAAICRVSGLKQTTSGSPSWATLGNPTGSTPVEARPATTCIETDPWWPQEEMMLVRLPRATVAQTAASASSFWRLASSMYATSRPTCIGGLAGAGTRVQHMSYCGVHHGVVEQQECNKAKRGMAAELYTQQVDGVPPRPTRTPPRTLPTGPQAGCVVTHDASGMMHHP
jgi:hypothetical protein